jgi:hypothetical protein
MKLMWFHLMPYTELPEDFRDKHPRYGSTSFLAVRPAARHHMCNDFMDGSNSRMRVRRAASEHHSNGYGLMPSPNLIASALARHQGRRAVRDGELIGALQSADPGCRRIRDDRLISGRRLIASFPVGTPMDTCFAYGQNPSMLRDEGIMRRMIS